MLAVLLTCRCSSSASAGTTILRAFQRGRLSLPPLSSFQEFPESPNQASVGELASGTKPLRLSDGNAACYPNPIQTY